jgi:hypothetical protein
MHFLMSVLRLNFLALFVCSGLAQALDLSPPDVWSRIVALPTDTKYGVEASWPNRREAALQKKLFNEYGERLSAGDNDWVCEFPARAHIVARVLGQDPNALLAKCGELQEFLARVPFDKLSLVFASEQLNAPASIMGHSFLKMEGLNEEAESVSYAISFFTNISTFNLPGLLTSILFTGRDGHVALGPYEQMIVDYVDVGERSIWEVEIEMTAKSRLLTQLHIWELRQAAPEYLFVSFNCATFLDRLLAIASSDGYEPAQRFVTPLDLFKKASAISRQQTKVVPSRDWVFRSLGGSLEVPASDIEKALTRDGAPNLYREFSATELVFAQALNEDLFSTHKITQVRALENHRGLERALLLKNVNSSEYWLQNHKTPLNVKPDSQAFSSLEKFGEEERLKIGYLPAARQFMDNRDAYFAQQENVLAQLTVSVDMQDDDVRLEEFVVLSLKSVVPKQKYSDAFSFKFDFSARRFVDETLQRPLSANLSGAYGVGFSLSPDVTAYGFLGGGVRSNKSHNTWAFGEVEAGLLVKQVFATRGALVFTRTYPDTQERNGVSELKYDFQVDLAPSSALWMTAGSRKSSQREEEFFELGIKRFF